MLEQKPGESFDDFLKRASAVASAREFPFVWLENLYIYDGPASDWRTPLRVYRGAETDRDKIHRPSHQRGHPIHWQ
jgi:hypothetical protein